ncbi:MULTISPECIES: hypothetical protein [Methanosarcina]|uniref:hypothetical protein n=1 Tax=Methanosarcina TaxID=2207 RepID=UPI001140A767|nr:MULTISPECIES: hypothetical protein [Methanosarcina]MDW5548792.1 hypothetical protein [Methanosarcina sp.]MDW5553705.1 hypothetical protein [Methanosarcina sp.]MDW5558931.1 hypothetical protein [Methanosarcina sp.]
MSSKRKMHWIPRTLPGGEGRLSDLPGRYASSRPELYCSRYPNSFRHLQISDPLPSLSSRSILLKDRFYDPGRPKSRHPALI